MMSMQGRDNESEAEPEPPDSFNSPGLGRIRGISSGISMSRDRNRGGYAYENARNAKENHARKQRHWLISNPKQIQISKLKIQKFFSQLLRLI